MTCHGSENDPDCRNRKGLSMLTTYGRHGLWLSCPWVYADSPIRMGLVMVSKGDQTSGFCMRDMHNDMSANSPGEVG